MNTPETLLRQGFTLIEVMIAITILGLVAVGTAGVIQANRQNTHTSGGQSGAAAVLRFLTSELSKGNNTFAPGSGETKNWEYGELAAAFAFAEGQDFADIERYKATVFHAGMVSAGTARAPVELTRYTVRVCWNDRDNPCLSQTAYGNPPSVVRASAGTPTARVPNASGVLTVDLERPTGLQPQVSVTGGGRSETLDFQTSNTALVNLPNGLYTISAADVNLSGYRYSAFVSQPSASFSSATAQRVRVIYTAASGRLIVSLTPPPGATAQITLDQPGGSSRTLSASETVENAAPGAYRVTAPPVRVGLITYTPTISSNPTQVQAGKTSTVNITYGAATATLRLKAKGVSEADFQVAGPGGYLNSVRGSSVRLDNLTPGNYVITAERQTLDEWHLQPATARVTLTAGANLEQELDFVRTSSKLDVRIIGSPSGSKPLVSISGPTSHSLSANTVLSLLDPGVYGFSANTLSHNGYLYHPTLSESGTTLGAGRVGSLVVNYAVSTGILEVRRTGIPDYARAPITVVGPGGYRRVLVRPTTLTNLAPGTYRVSSTPVSGSGWQNYNYITTGEQSAEIEAGQTAVVTLRYYPTSTNLAVEVDKPKDLVPTLTVRGPGVDRSLNDSAQFNGLEIGTYIVTARPATMGAFTYTAEPPSYAINTTAGYSYTASFIYRATTGLLRVNLTGPTGKTVRVQGADYDRTLTDSELLNLPPGNYTLTTHEYLHGGYAYEGPRPQTIAVVRGQTVNANIVYQNTSGNLELRITTPAQGAQPQVRLTGPNGYSELFDRSTSLTKLAPGSYTLSGPEISTPSARYEPVFTPITFQIAIGTTANAVVTYRRTTSSLSLTVNKPVTTLPVAVRVTGPAAYNQTFSAPAQLTPLAPGTYSLSAATVEHQGITYTATVSPSSLQLGPSEDGSATVTYAASDAIITVVINAPTGARPAASLVGPGGFNRPLEPGENTFTQLLPGIYTVQARDYTDPQTLYIYKVSGDPLISTTAGDSVRREFTYTATTGNLTIQSSPSLSGLVVLRGPNLTRNVAIGATVNGLEPSDYTITAPDINTADNHYRPTNPTRATVRVGQTTTATVAYNRTSWSLRMNVSIPGSLGGVQVGSYRRSTANDTSLFGDTYLNPLAEAETVNLRTPSVLYDSQGFVYPRSSGADNLTFSRAGGADQTTQITYDETHQARFVVWHNLDAQATIHCGGTNYTVATNQEVILTLPSSPTSCSMYQPATRQIGVQQWRLDPSLPPSQTFGAYPRSSIAFSYQYRPTPTVTFDVSPWQWPINANPVFVVTPGGFSSFNLYSPSHSMYDAPKGWYYLTAKIIYTDSSYSSNYGDGSGANYDYRWFPRANVALDSVSMTEDQPKNRSGWLNVEYDLHHVITVTYSRQRQVCSSRGFFGNCTGWTWQDQ